jgi:hypothetical protein
MSFRRAIARRNLFSGNGFLASLEMTEEPSSILITKKHGRRKILGTIKQFDAIKSYATHLMYKAE